MKTSGPSSYVNAKKLIGKQKREGEIMGKHGKNVIGGGIKLRRFLGVGSIAMHLKEHRNRVVEVLVLVEEVEYSIEVGKDPDVDYKDDGVDDSLWLHAKGVCPLKSLKCI